jgi:hypothetical protein
METVKIKYCWKCKGRKPLDEFYSNKAAPSGISGICKDCARTMALSRYHAKRAENRARGRNYYRLNKEKVLARQKATSKARAGIWYANNKEKHLARARVRYALQTGKIIKPKECSACHLQLKLQGHHEDYSKPLEIIWLCQQCHDHKHHGEK